MDERMAEDSILADGSIVLPYGRGAIVHETSGQEACRIGLDQTGRLRIRSSGTDRGIKWPATMYAPGVHDLEGICWTTVGPDRHPLVHLLEMDREKRHFRFRSSVNHVVHPTGLISADATGLFSDASSG